MCNRGRFSKDRPTHHGVQVLLKKLRLQRSGLQTRDKRLTLRQSGDEPQNRLTGRAHSLSLLQRSGELGAWPLALADQSDSEWIPGCQKEHLLLLFMSHATAFVSMWVMCAASRGNLPASWPSFRSKPFCSQKAIFGKSHHG